MADERIDIEINDKIASSIPTKLRDIATNADKADASVKRLKADLAAINDTPARRLKDATDNMTNSLNRELSAQKASVTTTNDSVAALKKEAEQRARISAMVDKSIAQQEREAAAIRARMAAGGPITGAATVASVGSAGIGAEAAALGGSAVKVEQTVAAAEAATVSSFARIRNAGIAAYDGVRDAGYTWASKFQGFFGANGAKKIEEEAVAVEKLGAHAKGNSTAMRELFVLAREGGRGDFTRMAGSVTILAGALGLLETVLIPLAVLLAPIAAGLKLFQMSFAKESEPELKKYADTLGLTSKEMRKLGDETVGAHGKLKEFNTVTITMGDTFHGFLATVKEGMSGFGDDFAAATNRLGVNWGNVWSNMLTISKMFIVGLTGLVQGLVAWVTATIGNVFKIIANVGIGIGNFVALAIRGIVNTAIEGINLLATGANKILPAAMQIPLINEWKTKVNGVTDGMLKLTHVDIAGTVVKGMKSANATMDAFGQRLKANTLAAAKARLAEEAAAIKANRNPKKGSTADPKTKADYLNDTNKQLDDELSRMHMLKDAREEQQRLNQIEEEFAKRRQPLTKTEIEGFRAKIHAINDYKYVQAELDRIYENAVGPQRTYNSSVAAAKELLDQGAISATRYQQELVKASRALAEATDPLFAMKEAMDTASIAATKYGTAVDRGNYYEQIRQAYLKQGTVLSSSYVAGINAEVDALMKKNDALLQQQYIQSQVGSVINPMLEDQKFLDNKSNFYAEIDKLRQQDVLNEEQAARAKQAILAKYDELRLQGASSFFGELAALSSSHNKKLAAIGKAAAIAQATIDGFVAVQKALASGPPPWNFLMATAVAMKTGAQVAGIMSTNVGNFQDGGAFMVDGKAGVDNNNISMNVSRGERVTIETPAQQRANDGGGNGGPTNVHVKSIVQFDPRNMIDALDTAEGEHVVMTIVERRSADIKKVLGS